MFIERATDLTRRKFVQLSAAFLGALVLPSGLEAHGRRRRRRRRRHVLHMYRWSGRGRRVSRAALAHAANRRYATPGAAKRDLPHPGANLRLVRVDVSFREFVRLFVSRRSFVVDLRRV